MLKYEDLPAVNSERWKSLEDLPEEVWKDVPNYEGVLRVSNYARVVKLPRYWSPATQVLTQISYGGGSLAVSISIKRKQIKLLVHRLVASAFIEKQEARPYIDHIDNNKQNNVCSNLHWVTHKENMNNPITKQRRSKKYHKNKSTAVLQS